MGDKRVVANASWIIVCRLVQAILSFLISLFTARYLGPSNFGLINYAISLTAFVTPIMKLGFDSILVQEFINNPKKEGTILGSSLLMNVISAIACMVLVISFSFFANPGELETVIVCALYSLMLLAQALEMTQYWFQAKLLSKYTAIVSLVSYVLVSTYKIFLLATSKSIFWFAISNAVDYFLIAISLLLLYRRKGGMKLEFSFDLSKKMLSKSKYYIISGLMVVVFSQTDRIMLKQMVNNAAVGYYSAAVTCAGMTSFIFSAIIDSMRPIIFEGKNSGDEVFKRRVRELYSLIIYGALTQSVLITIFSSLIVNLIYGPEYTSAIIGLRIVVWYTTFSYYGGAKDIWILAEGKQKYLVWLNLCGALANVGLNYILIPIWGIAGAAIASLITQFFANIVMGFIIPDLRPNNLLLMESLNPKYIREMLIMLTEIIKNKIVKTG